MRNGVQWSAVPSIKPVSLQPLRLEAASEVVFGVGMSAAGAAARAGMQRGRSVSMVEADMPLGKEGLAELEKKLTMSQSRVHSNSDGENENNNSQSSGSLSVCAHSHSHSLHVHTVFHTYAYSYSIAIIY